MKDQTMLLILKNMRYGFIKGGGDKDKIQQIIIKAGEQISNEYNENGEDILNIGIYTTQNYTFKDFTTRVLLAIESTKNEKLIEAYYKYTVRYVMSHYKTQQDQVHNLRKMLLYFKNNNTYASLLYKSLLSTVVKAKYCESGPTSVYKAIKMVSLEVMDDLVIPKIIDELPANLTLIINDLSATMSIAFMCDKTDWQKCLNSLTKLRETSQNAINTINEMCSATSATGGRAEYNQEHIIHKHTFELIDRGIARCDDLLCFLAR